MINIPKGSMCLVCIDLHKYCAHLPFDTYPPMEKIDKNDPNYQVVKCKQFTKR